MSKPVKNIIGQAGRLQVETGSAEASIRRLMRKIARAHRANAREQERCSKVRDSVGYQKAVAEEAALNQAYQRLNDALGRMCYGGS